MSTVSTVVINLASRVCVCVYVCVWWGEGAQRYLHPLLRSFLYQMFSIHGGISLLKRIAEGSTTKVKAMLAEGADVNTSSVYGSMSTALHVAIREGKHANRLHVMVS